MKQVSLVLLVLAVATGNAFASPQSQSRAHGAKGHAPATAPVASDEVARTFAALDANKDGRLSKEELAKHPMAAHASMVDADKNGNLSREEFTALQKM